MILNCLVGMVTTTPMGMLIVAVCAKWVIIILPDVLIVLSCSVNYFLPPHLGTITLSHTLIVLIDDAIALAIYAITLGIVGPSNFDRLLGKNEAFNYGGNAISALVYGVLSYFYGLGAVFV